MSTPSDQSIKTISVSNGRVTVIVDAADYDAVSKHRWHLCGGKVGYLRRYVGRAANGKTLYLHRELMGCPVGKYIDHINGDPFDNRRCNLRVATAFQSSGNVRKRKGTSSRFKGVSWDSRYQRWVVWVGPKNIGRFKDEIEAARAYNDVARQVFGEFALLNITPEAQP